MERVLTDEKLRKKFASNARAVIASRYEQKKMWEALRAIYRSLIGE
jgi:glycosyltransferase involved in cell wall biosynthesis